MFMSVLPEGSTVASELFRHSKQPSEQSLSCIRQIMTRISRERFKKHELTRQENREAVVPQQTSISAEMIEHQLYSIELQIR